MILTRKQAERIVKQGRSDKKAIIRILRGEGVAVIDKTDPNNPKMVDLAVQNSDKTKTRICANGGKLNVFVSKDNEMTPYEQFMAYLEANKDAAV